MSLNGGMRCSLVTVKGSVLSIVNSCLAHPSKADARGAFWFPSATAAQSTPVSSLFAGAGARQFLASAQRLSMSLQIRLFPAHSFQCFGNYPFGLFLSRFADFPAVMLRSGLLA